MDREQKIFNAVLAYVDAQSLLTEDEKDLLCKYDQAIKDLYPDGVPPDQEEQILEAMSKEFPGVDEVINKLLETSDLIRMSQSNKPRL